MASAASLLGWLLAFLTACETASVLQKKVTMSSTVATQNSNHSHSTTHAKDCHLMTLISALVCGCRMALSCASRVLGPTFQPFGALGHLSGDCSLEQALDIMTAKKLEFSWREIQWAC